MSNRIANTEAAETQKYAAYLNARITSAVNKTHFSSAQKLSATRTEMALRTYWEGRCKDIYVNYRKTCVAIKIDNPGRARDGYKQFENECVAMGYIKKESAQGIIWNIPKN